MRTSALAKKRYHQVRFTDDEKRLLEEAATLERMSVSALVAKLVVPAAQRIVRRASRRLAA